MIACCRACRGGSHAKLPPSEMPSMILLSYPTFVHSSQPCSIVPRTIHSVSPSVVATAQPSTVAYEKCEDLEGFNIFDPQGFWGAAHTCSHVAELPGFWCTFLSIFYGAESFSSFNVTDTCCACGGGTITTDIRSKEPSESPSSSPTRCIDEPD